LRSCAVRDLAGKALCVLDAAATTDDVFEPHAQILAMITSS
jgi:hypothetical protein